MGLWCAGHFHNHCSEEASLLEYPLMVSNASSELKSDHVRQLFVLLCEYMGFCLGFVSLLINGPSGRQLRLPGSSQFPHVT